MIDMLIDIVEKNEIDVSFSSMPDVKSLSIEYNNDYYIVIDPLEIKTSAEFVSAFCHELGHCVTGSFYNMYSTLDIRSKHEYVANKWAIKKLIPKDELVHCFKLGYTEIWQIAEYFNVTEELVLKAVEYYKNN